MKRGHREDRWAYWRDIVAQQGASGQSVSVFCQERGIAEASWYAWRRRLEAETSVTPDAKPAQFVAVPLAAVASDFEVRLPNGILVTVPREFDDVSLQRLLQTLTRVERSHA